MNSARNIATVLITATAISIFGVALWRISGSKRSHVDVRRDCYPIVGVDISSHNGNVDFDKVKASGVSFVFLKATEGLSFVDPRFAANHRAARAAGLKVGAYHFFRFDSDGYRQGLHFLATVDTLPLDLPLVIDVEQWSNSDAMTTQSVSEALRGMVFALEGRGRNVMIYTNKKGYSRFVRGRLEELPLWLCSFTDPPMPSGGWVLWQHSHEGTVEGITGKADLNTFNGDSAAWRGWLDRWKAAPDTPQ